MNSMTTQKIPATMRMISTLFIGFSFLSMVEILLKRFRHDDDGRTQSDQEQRWKDEEHKRKDQFDCGLCSLLLHLLAALGSKGIRVNAQSFSGAGPKLF